MRKFAIFSKAIFSTHYNIFQPNFETLQLFKGSFREFCDSLDKKISL